MSRRQNNSGDTIPSDTVDINRYDVYKTVSVILFDISVIQSLIGILIYTLANRDKNGLEDIDTALVVMTVFTLMLYILLFLLASFLLFVKYTYRYNKVFNAALINMILTIFSGIGLLFNVTVTFLAVQSISNR